ncbi:MAG TPA: alpha/beta fold hydrolase [Chloroflexia bacterium]|nr:alpha/beta fold hydrolase [Chloroflexia bacterium]
MTTKVQERPLGHEPEDRGTPGTVLTKGSSRVLWYLLGLSLVLVLLGNSLAWAIQTDWGNVKIKDVRFMGTNGTQMSALLYIPNGVTNKKPAPGILAVHGYINSRETQDGFAIEFARRGYVVLAMDQTGHGYSDPPAFGNGFGGPDGLNYLRSLDLVDKNNIGMEGHSMGGWTIGVAAGVFKDGYKSMVLEGSSTGTLGAPDGTPTFPRNLGLVYSKYDEFSQLMWGVDKPTDIVKTKKLQTLFNTTDTVEVGKLYGSIQDGTARKLYQPATTHPQDHISPEAIGDAMEWMGMTLQGGKSMAPSDQVWFWKEFGNLVALIGMVLFIFPLGGLLLRTRFFGDLREALPERKGLSGVGWWVGAVIMVAVPIITFYWFQHWSDDNVKPSGLFPQSINNGVMMWAIFNGLIALGLFLVWHFALNRRAGGTFANYGLTWQGGGLAWRKIGKSALLAITVMAGCYLLLAISDWLFKTDFRFWVLAVKLMNSLQFRIFLSYLLPFTAFFLVQGMLLQGQMRLANRKGEELGLGKTMLINVALLAVGFVFLLLFQYIPFFAGGTMTIPTEPLLTIVAFQFVPLLAIVALIQTYFIRKTGHIYTGAFMSAIFITWVIVAGSAIQFAL